MSNDNFSFRLSGPQSKRLNQEILKSGASPSKYIQSAMIQHLDNDEAADVFHREIEAQLQVVMGLIRSDQEKFKAEIHELVAADLMENRNKIRETMNKFVAALNVLNGIAQRMEGSAKSGGH